MKVRHLVGALAVGAVMWAGIVALVVWVSGGMD